MTRQLVKLTVVAAALLGVGLLPAHAGLTAASRPHARVDAAAVHSVYPVRSTAHLPVAMSGYLGHATSGSWTCWDNGSPDPCLNDLNDVDVMPDGTGWAVGSRGVILRIEGSEWLRSPTPTLANLQAVEIIDANDAWSVGDEGAILRWDGVTWRHVASPTSGDLYDISMVSPSDGWAVGRQRHGPSRRSVALAIHWDGTAWTEAAMPDGVQGLHAVSLASSDHGWAGGLEIVRWDGESWTEYDLRPCESVQAFAMVDERDGWRVDRCTTWHWDGVSWLEARVPSAGLEDLKLDPTGVPWLVSVDTVFRWDGQAWTRMNDAYQPSPRTPRAIAMHSETEGWTVGDGGTVASVQDVEWLSVIPDEPSPHLSLGFVAADDGWAAGWYRLAHWNGATWTDRPAVHLGRLEAIDLLDSDHGWAVGEDVIARREGGVWSVSDSLENIGLLGVSQLTEQDAWAVGYAYEPFGPDRRIPIARALHWDGTAWQEVPVPVHGPYRGVDMVATDDVWAVGGHMKMTNLTANSCAIAHWDGQAWLDVACPTEQRLHDIDMLSADDGWAVGGVSPGFRPDSECVILRFDGVTWRRVSCPIEAELRAVEMKSPGDGWAVGHDGAVLHWDGVTWQRQHSPVSGMLHDVAFGSTELAWAVGSGPTMLEWRGIGEPN